MKEQMERDMKAQFQAAASKVVADYKASEEFKNEKFEFAVDAYESGLDVVWRRVADKYPDLDLSFLDEV